MNWRALRPLYRAGGRLLEHKRFDLVFISTGKFTFFLLGPLWRRAYGVPYVLDFHDPWVKESSHATTKGKLKARAARLMAPALERFSVRRASAIVAVSPHYVDQLAARHGSIPPLQDGFVRTIPFSTREADMRPVTGAAPGAEGVLQIAYVGAGGAIMERGFRGLCEVLRDIASSTPDLLDRVRICLYGTNPYWKPGDPCTLQDIAGAFGLDFVKEDPRWVPYSESISLAAHAAGLIVLGVDEAAYMPSKLFPYLLIGKPLLACLHRESPAISELQRMQGAEVLSFPKEFGVGEDAAGSVKRFLAAVRGHRHYDRKQALLPRLAPAMAREIASLFDRVVDRDRPINLPSDNPTI
jgi:hypothetical protein